MANELPELLTGSRIGDFAEFHIDVIELNDLIEIHGIGCELRKAVRNPDMRVETGSPRTGGYGNGLRFVYPEEDRQCVVAVITQRGPKRELVMAGDIVTGDAYATFPLGVHPAEGDMLLPDGELHIVTETLYRQVQQIDNAAAKGRMTASKYPPIQPPRVQLARPEVLLYPDVDCIEGIWWVVEDDDGSKRLAKANGNDYRIEGNRIEWTDGCGPEAGVSYTVRYRAPAAYICYPGEPIYRSEGPNRLGMPYRCPIRRLDRWGDPDLRDNR